MRQYILVALAALALTACSSNDEGSFAPSWGDLTMTQTKGAITDYTEVVYQHSKEPIANYSFKAVQLCQIKESGMTEEDLIDLIQADYNQAKKCWNALLTYNTRDKRFIRDGSIEKEVYAEFIQNAPRYRTFFVND